VDGVQDGVFSHPTVSRMTKIYSTILVLLVFAYSSALAQDPNLEGKTIRMVVGFSSGGGFDAYARAIARHMGKYLPGKADDHPR
jgi:tripartite-type tricarboxylate transporter receptor subunit TctC